MTSNWKECKIEDITDILGDGLHGTPKYTEDGKYAFVNTDGSDSILNFLFDAIYIKTSEGEKSYWMTFRGKEYEVLKYLKQSNVKQNTLETVTNAINTTNANQ